MQMPFFPGDPYISSMSLVCCMCFMCLTLGMITTLSLVGIHVWPQIKHFTAKKIMFPELARVTRICQPCSSYMDCHMKASQHLAFVISFPFFLN